MSLLILRRFVVVALGAFALAAMGAQAQSSMHETPVEIALLPQFCWAQLNVPNATGDDFRIRDCGPAANHYCPALISIVRAKHTSNKQSRLGLLGRADVDVRYTERAIADYPNCSIREHVASTRATLNNLMTMYGFKRPRAQ
jgi:hypothetical protein